MKKIVIVGALGRMGNKVAEAIANTDGVEVLFGIDKTDAVKDFPVYSSFDKAQEKPDAIIDFSSPASLDSVLDYAVKFSVPAVLCSTGYSDEDVKKIENASKKTAIFRSANMSLGVNVVIDLIKKAGNLLKGYDVEIIEEHHKNKVDAPSGTALMLFDALKEVCPEKTALVGRDNDDGKRKPDEVGIHSIRGGNIVGVHQIKFIGENEEIVLSHTAFDRKVFAEGAVKASLFIIGKKKGLYSMKDLVCD